jgi:NAD-dependent SIR2 family protein deacetylase
MQEKTYHYRCKRCNWNGTDKDMDSELVDTCMGDEPIYICPKCGSYEVVMVKPDMDSK